MYGVTSACAALAASLLLVANYVFRVPLPFPVATMATLAANRVLHLSGAGGEVLQQVAHQDRRQHPEHARRHRGERQERVQHHARAGDFRRHGLRPPHRAAEDRQGAALVGPDVRAGDAEPGEPGRLPAGKAHLHLPRPGERLGREHPGRPRRDPAPHLGAAPDREGDARTRCGPTSRRSTSRWGYSSPSRSC